MEVQILSGAPFLIFDPLEDHVEGLSVSGINTCGVNRAVRKHHFEEFGFFGGRLRKIQRMRLIREF